MGLVKKGKAVPEDADAKKPVQAKPAKKGRRKKKYMMSSVISESVIDNVMVDFQSNKQFVTQHNGETAYVGLFFEAESIGGICSARKNEESIGTLVSYINGGNICALVTKDLLDEDCMVFCPNKQTVESMSEFGVLQNAPYLLCYVYEDGAVDVLNDKQVSFDTIVRVVENGLSIEYLFNGEENVHDNAGYDGMYGSGDDIPYLDEDDEEEGAETGADSGPAVFDNKDFMLKPDEAPAVDDEVPFGQGSAYESEVGDETDYTGGGTFDEEMPFNGGSDYSSDFDTPPEEDTEEYDGSGAEEYADEQSDYDEEITEEDVQATIVRRFYSDEVGIELDSSAFDAQYLYQTEQHLFDENRGDSWLDKYVSQMSHDANVRLKQLHQSNIFTMRENYMYLLQLSYEELLKDYSLTDEGTQFGRQYIQAQSYYDDKMLSAGDLVKKRRDELEADWKAKLDSVGEEAASAARSQYEERFGRQHRLEVDGTENYVCDNIEAERQKALSDIKEERRKAVLARVDSIVAEALAAVHEMYEKCQSAELEMYRQEAENINAYVDEHRKEDITAMECQRKEKEHFDKIQAIEAEYKAKIESLTGEFESTKLLLRERAESAESDSRREVKRMELACDERVESEKQRGDKLQENVDSLLGQLAALDEAKNKEYSARINQLINEKDSLKEQCNHMVENSRRSNTFVWFFIAAAVIASIAVGFIFGSAFSMKSAREDTESDIVRELEDMMHEDK